MNFFRDVWVFYFVISSFSVSIYSLEGMNWIENSFKEYFISDFTATKHEALSFCNISKAYLPRFRNIDEYSFIEYLLKSIFGTEENTKIYLDLELINNSFYWSDKSKLHTFAHFNKSTNLTDAKNPCVIVSNNDIWTPSNCTTSLYFVCERNVGSLWTAWDSWSYCSEPCGHGAQKRHRFCIEASSAGRQKCKIGDYHFQTKVCEIKNRASCKHKEVAKDKTWGYIIIAIAGFYVVIVLLIVWYRRKQKKKFLQKAMLLREMCYSSRDEIRNSGSH